MLIVSSSYARRSSGSPFGADASSDSYAPPSPVTRRCSPGILPLRRWRRLEPPKLLLTLCTRHGPLPDVVLREARGRGGPARKVARLAAGEGAALAASALDFVIELSSRESRTANTKSLHGPRPSFQAS